MILYGEIWVEPGKSVKLMDTQVLIKNAHPSFYGQRRPQGDPNILSNGRRFTLRGLKSQQV